MEGWPAAYCFICFAVFGCASSSRGFSDIMCSFFFFFNDTATTEIYTLHIVGSVRCVQETGINAEYMGIPVSCGASLTNTLAKVATWFAKHYPAYHEICILPKDKIDMALRKLPIQDVWGIGRASVPRLRYDNINTAYEFAFKSESYIQHRFSIAGVRTWKELHGVSCIDVSSPPKQRSIMLSRTFAYMTDSEDALHTYISNFAAGAARKLRDQHSVCRTITTFIVTNRHRDDLSQYGNSATRRFTTPTADTVEIVKGALDMLHQIFLSGYQYKNPCTLR
eukprot:TRINITY_DN13544_c0_g1_i4.p1 TRINITY_DN13544_c0_g1~~TRINITY_DN13544_c0_g1_i4.p1  ORF type:complete len:280 (+),score=-2.02 TRINITY_DN13544_c0_g1_i4:31-870(+)